MAIDESETDGTVSDLNDFTYCFCTLLPRLIKVLRETVSSSFLLQIETQNTP